MTARHKNFTSSLKLFGDKISSAGTAMETKAMAAVRASRESAFWHFDDTGEVIPGMAFHGLKIQLSEGFTIPEFDSENGRKATDKYLLILMVNREGLDRLLEKMGLEDEQALVLESTNDPETSGFYERLWRSVESVLSDAYRELQHEQVDLMNRVNAIHKQKKNIKKAAKIAFTGKSAF